MSDYDPNVSMLLDPVEYAPTYLKVLIRHCANEIKWNGRKVGIFAAEVCQLCGGMNTFNGLVSALAVHVGPLQEFVCRRCRPSLDSESRAKATECLGQQPYRYCELCRERVGMSDDHRFGHRWLCQACLDAIHSGREWDDPQLFLNSLVRQRYVLSRFNTVDQLRAFHLRLEAMRLDMEEIWAPNEAERERLRATRGERAKAIIARYSGEQNGGTTK